MTVQPNTQDRELLLRIKTIMILRALLLLGFVVVAFTFQKWAFTQIPLVPPMGPLSAVIGTAFFLFLISALLLNHCSNLTLVAIFQVTSDLFVVAGILYTTGGIESPFTFLNILVIIATSILLPRAVCYLIASGASIFYGLLVDLEFYEIIHPVLFIPKSQVTEEGGYVFYMIFLNFLSYYSVAFLSSMLSHRLKVVKEELATKNIDLEKLQAFNLNILHNMEHGLWTTDMSGNITSANPAAQKITGFTLEDSLGHPCFNLLDIPNFQDLFQAPILEILPRQIEGECHRKDGNTILIRMKINRLIQDNQPKGVICVFEDLTEIKGLEKKMAQAEKLAEIGKISAGLAHEIRNPLASLSGSIQVLQKSPRFNDTEKRLMEIVVKETRRLDMIVSDFLNYAHPSKARKSLIDLTQVIHEVITLLKNNPQYNDSVQIHFNNENERFLINGDEQEIKDVLWNLCINGVQAMPEGGNLDINLEKVKQFSKKDFISNQQGIVLTVKDEGGGIPQEELENIFDPFFTTKDSGVGLGLAKVFQVINQSDGYVAVESKVSQGTRFIVYLPESAIDAALNISNAPVNQTTYQAGN